MASKILQIDVIMKNLRNHEYAKYHTYVGLSF